MHLTLFRIASPLAICAVLTACGSEDEGVSDGAIYSDESLGSTGLFSDLATEQLSPGVRAYRPRYELWSDGAEKRRWILLPEGERIDTSNMDDWVFPVGTKLWKEFSRDGTRA